VRALQLAIGALVLPSLVAGAYVALEAHRRWMVPAAYFGITLLAAVIAVLSYRDMLRAGAVASAQLTISLSVDVRGSKSSAPLT
jgi:hypothetical protein